MNAQPIQLAADLAKQGAGSSGRISTTGKYVGAIVQAKYIEFDSGAKGIEFSFESAMGEEGRFTLCTHNKSGEAVYGYKQLQAIMACMRLREIQPAQLQVEEYDFQTKSKRTVARICYPDMDKPIGLVLQREDYTSDSNGQDYFRMNLIAPFCADTEQTALEVLNQDAASQLEKIVLSVKDKDSRKSAQQKGATAASGAPAATGFDEFDDDIPF